MTVLHIVKLGAAVLRQKAEPIVAMTPELERVIDDMIETMYDAPGVGLAAPQVGVARRLFVADPDFREDRDSRAARVFINPEILDESDEDDGDDEGCLSIPGLTSEVFRPVRIRVRALDRRMQPFEIEATDLFARIILHENDHLDGVLFVDRLPLPRRTLLLPKLNAIRQEARGDEARLAGQPGPPWPALPHPHGGASRPPV